MRHRGVRVAGVGTFFQREVFMKRGGKLPQDPFLSHLMWRPHLDSLAEKLYEKCYNSNEEQ